MQAREMKYSWEKIEIAVQKIVHATEGVDLKLIRTILIEFIDGYKPSIEAFPEETLDDYHQYIKEVKVTRKSHLKGLS